MKVRKVPLKKFTYAEKDDGGVAALVSSIRKVVLTDRDLHERVRSLRRSYWQSLIWTFAGNESFRLIRSSLFEARSVVHLPSQGS